MGAPPELPPREEIERVVREQLYRRMTSRWQRFIDRYATPVLVACTLALLAAGLRGFRSFELLAYEHRDFVRIHGELRGEIDKLDAKIDRHADLAEHSSATREKLAILERDLEHLRRDTERRLERYKVP